MADDSGSAKSASEEASITPGPGSAEDQPREKGSGKEDGKDQAAPAPEPKDDLVTTHHVLRVGRRRLKYTATAGRVVLREERHEDGTFKGNTARGVISMTSYVLDDADPRTRPVVFAFNGGPGSSSVWLHLGLLGPRRVVMGDVGALQPPPYGLADNPESLLTVADLVFVDPMSTGWSRAVEGGKPGEYHGFQRDVEHVGELIRLWTSRATGGGCPRSSSPASPTAPCAARR